MPKATAIPTNAGRPAELRPRSRAVTACSFAIGGWEPNFLIYAFDMGYKFGFEASIDLHWCRARLYSIGGLAKVNAKTWPAMVLDVFRKRPFYGPDQHRSPLDCAWRMVK